MLSGRKQGREREKERKEKKTTHKEFGDAVVRIVDNVVVVLARRDVVALLAAAMDDVRDSCGGIVVVSIN